MKREKKTGRVRIGTSNVVVPGNKTTFPEAYRAKTRLHYYSSIFDTVEINSCFYKTPLRSTFEKWSLDVPQEFRFTLKLCKEITHSKELTGDMAAMEKFMSAAGGIGIKKGCLLIQFPGKISLDHFEQVENILEELTTLDTERQWRIAVEFRNTSWYTGETWELLDEFGATMVLQDIRKAPIFVNRSKADFVYIRFHGPDGDYRGSYSENFLDTKSVEIKEWLREGKDVYIYFNNTIGKGYENAVYLKTLLSSEKEKFPADSH